MEKSKTQIIINGSLIADTMATGDWCFIVPSHGDDIIRINQKAIKSLEQDKKDVIFVEMGQLFMCIPIPMILRQSLDNGIGELQCYLYEPSNIKT